MRVHIRRRWNATKPDFRFIPNPSNHRQPEFSNKFCQEIVSHVNGLGYDVSCYVHVDEDTRTAQYVGSCGSAALTVALRHLHPGRIGKTGGPPFDNKQPIADLDFAFEVSRPKTDKLLLSDLGASLGEPVYRGRPGYILWNQLTFFGLTKNQVGAFMTLFNKENETPFRLYFHHTQPLPRALKYTEKREEMTYEPDRFFVKFSDTEDALEHQLLNILINNRLAVALVDGLVYTLNDHYRFPMSEKEWLQRGSDFHRRPRDCLVVEEHPVLEALKDALESMGCSNEPSGPQDQKVCTPLQHAYNHLKGMLGPTMIGHAVVVSGVYVHSDSGILLWRVLDSNGPQPTRLNLKRVSQKKKRASQGSINYMTTKELYCRMKGTTYNQFSPDDYTMDQDGILRMLEVVPGVSKGKKTSETKRNLIAPVIHSNFQ